jgi:hypothetical protein
VEAIELQRRLRAFGDADGATSSYFLAMIDAGLRRDADALHDLEVAYQGRSGYLTRIKTDPVFEPLHAQPRFQHLLQNMGLAGPGQAASHAG